MTHPGGRVVVRQQVVHPRADDIVALGLAVRPAVADGDVIGPRGRRRERQDDRAAAVGVARVKRRPERVEDVEIGVVKAGRAAVTREGEVIGAAGDQRDPPPVAVARSLERRGERAGAGDDRGGRGVAGNIWHGTFLSAEGPDCRRGPRTAKRGATKRLVGQLLSLSAKRRKREGRPPGRPPLASRSGPQASELSMPLQASTRPFTASIDFCIIACSSSFISISMTFSMPPAPITVGTPTYIPSRP
ncbi:hypothetical protein SAMN05444276_102424 [Paracoccus sanguinis]|uniref:Uncharacterized protein n=1 Tax=Paracoccus sanguinis TaxID=1545044 RepID=A0A1H2X920_9RHOB|nr:hypothetical protein SAMN05444276_102424 [Paracoccus sanguinis]